MTCDRTTLPRVGVLLAFLSVSLVAACHVREPGSPDTGLTKPVDPPSNPDMGHGPSRDETHQLYHLWLADSVNEVCQGPAPFFDFDSAALSASDQPTMRTLHTCMLTGPLKGRSIRLIGHTDPRGSVGYNESLGMERAERVKRYLVIRGVEASRIKVESAGEKSASAAPASWATDRRVQIELEP
jgi:peptidoglycan-associated lipoprotein